MQQSKKFKLVFKPKKQNKSLTEKACNAFFARKRGRKTKQFEW